MSLVDKQIFMSHPHRAALTPTLTHGVTMDVNGMEPKIGDEWLKPDFSKPLYLLETAVGLSVAEPLVYLVALTAL